MCLPRSIKSCLIFQAFLTVLPRCHQRSQTSRHGKGMQSDHNASALVSSCYAEKSTLRPCQGCTKADTQMATRHSHTLNVLGAGSLRLKWMLFWVKGAANTHPWCAGVRRETHGHLGFLNAAISFATLHESVDREASTPCRKWRKKSFKRRCHGGRNP